MSDNAKLITAHQVRALLGGCSDMWLWRRLNEEGSTFPRPIYIARRRFWREAEIVAWVDDQVNQEAA